MQHLDNTGKIYQIPHYLFQLHTYFKNLSSNNPDGNFLLLNWVQQCVIMSLKNGLEKGITLRHTYIYVVLLFSGIIIIPENNNTINLLYYENWFEKVWNSISTMVRKQISFLCCGFFTPAFYTIFSKTTSCHWLSINKLEWKIKPSFELGTWNIKPQQFYRL